MGLLTQQPKQIINELIPAMDEQIKQVRLPASDPAFGPTGLLFNFWK